MRKKIKTHFGHQPKRSALQSVIYKNFKTNKEKKRKEKNPDILQNEIRVK